MSKGFFNLIKTKSQKPETGITKCGSCGLSRKCKNPKFKVSGKGNKKILIILDMPSLKEDDRGKSLCDDRGSFLKKEFRKCGIDIKNDCWITYSIKCHTNQIGTNYALLCKSDLIKTIEKLKPISIISFGNTATNTIASYTWKDTSESEVLWQGWSIPSQKINSWIHPNFSTNTILSNSSNFSNKDNGVLKDMFRRNIKKAVKHKKHPYKIIPDYPSDIDIVLDSKEVIKKINRHMNKTKRIAFDYESNCLNPFLPKSKIISNSICFDGSYTIAYPFTPNVRDITERVLRSKKKKIAANLKFEHKWSRVKLGIKVKNWLWDTMIAAHVLDNRKGITSLKMQAFLQLGIEDYDSAIKPYLKSGKGDYNDIEALPIEDLLLYNGLDSLIEYKLAEYQMGIYYEKT